MPLDEFSWWLIDRMDQAKEEKNYYLSGYDQDQVPGKDGWRANIFACPGRELLMQFQYVGQWFDVRHDDIVLLPKEARDYLMSLTWYAPNPLNAIERMARAVEPLLGSFYEEKPRKDAVSRLGQIDVSEDEDASSTLGSEHPTERT